MKKKSQIRWNTESEITENSSCEELYKNEDILQLMGYTFELIQK